MKRILVFGITENPGGVESFLLNYYRQIDRRKLQIDFLCNTHREVAYEQELQALGGCVYHVAARSEDFRRYKRELEAFFRDTRGRYCAIWVNVSSLANIDYLKYAGKYGIERRIIHSHNSRNMDSALRGAVHRLNRLVIGRYATDFWACSAEAADWFYTGRTRRKAVLIHNAIPVETLRFDPEKRRRIREELKWQKHFVIGNIGRLHFQKNQKFILDIFAVLHRQMPDARLVLIGGGEDEAMLRERAKACGISEFVCFAGVRRDIAGWLSALDLFLFPSLFEGLSVVALEAQANGVMTLASAGVVPEELRLNENFCFMDLAQGAEAWARQIMRMRAGGAGRIPFAVIRESFQRSGYDIRTEAQKLEMRLLGTCGDYREMK